MAISGHLWPSLRWGSGTMKNLVPIPQIPVKYKKTLELIVTFTAEPWFIWLLPRSTSSKHLQSVCSSITEGTVHLEYVNGRWPGLMEIREEMAIYTNSPVSLNQDSTPLCALLCIFTSVSSRCTDVVAVDVSIFSYHSFLDCYPVPRFGVPILQVILQHRQRQPKGM